MIDPTIARVLIYLAVIGLCGVGLICMAFVMDDRERRDPFSPRYTTRTFTSP